MENNEAEASLGKLEKRVQKIASCKTQFCLYISIHIHT